MGGKNAAVATRRANGRGTVDDFVDSFFSCGVLWVGKHELKSLILLLCNTPQHPATPTGCALQNLYSPVRLTKRAEAWALTNEIHGATSGATLDSDLLLLRATQCKSRLLVSVWDDEA